MTKKEKIECDFCKRDITYSNGGYDHSIIIQDRKYGPDSDIIIDYYTNPILNKRHDFCGLKCLENWIKDK